MVITFLGLCGMTIHSVRCKFGGESCCTREAPLGVVSWWFDQRCGPRMPQEISVINSVSSEVQKLFHAWLVPE